MKIRTMIVLVMMCVLFGACENNKAATEESSDVNVSVEQVNTKKSDAHAEMISTSQELVKEAQNSEISSAYKACKDNIISTGTVKEDDFFDGYVYELPTPPNIADDSKFAGYIGTTEDSENLWVLFEYVGTASNLQGSQWDVALNGDTGNYEIQIPVTFNESSFPVRITGSFRIEDYTGTEPLVADEVTSDEGMMNALAKQLETYPSSVIPVCIEQLRSWLEKNESLDVSMQDLGFVSYQADAATEYLLNGSSDSSDKDTESLGKEENQSANSYKQESSNAPFTNKYGTQTTKCAHSGCNNYIASSGDTNCCVVHSNKCLDCGKYIDEDAMYCMDCLTKASKQSNSSYGSSGKSTYSGYGNNSESNIGEGGYEMPNENDKSLFDYVKRVDPDLYDEMFSD